MTNIIIALSISAIVFGTIAYCLAKAAAKERPSSKIKCGGIKPFEYRSMNNRLALGLLAQKSENNKLRK